MIKIILAMIFLLNASIAFALSPLEQEFIDKYKKAFEAKDQSTLESFLYSKGANPDALEFYKMMLTDEMGNKITSIELVDLSKEEAQEASGTLPSPDGGESKLPVAPTKKLILKIDISDENGTSKTSSQSFVAEVDGKLMIPVPVDVTK